VTNSFLVEAYGTSWSKVALISPLNSAAGVSYTNELPAGTTRLRFTYNKPVGASGNAAFDDVIVRGPAGAATVAGKPPGLVPIGAKSTPVGRAMQFAVTAVPTDGDAVTLTVSNPPAGSSFTATNEHGLFTWTNAAPMGVYTSAFYAAAWRHGRGGDHHHHGGPGRRRHRVVRKSQRRRDVVQQRQLRG
jgi:hypothetical protein